MHWRSLFYGFFGGGFPFWGKVFLLAQPATQDSVRHLKPVTVEAPRLMDFRAGQKDQVWDSAALAQYGQRNLADLLGAESSVFIKSYGPGLLASPALRGGSAQHMAVVWQGIPINSPMNGQSDLALIPVEAGDEIRIQYGGSIGLWGSGAVAGAVHLNSRPRFEKAFDMGLRLMAGSFGDFRQKIHGSWGSDKQWFSVKIFQGWARNDFSFLNTNFFPPEKQRLPHAAWHNMGLLCDGAVRLRRQQQLTLHAWMLQALRNLPPTMLQVFSGARQRDNVGRVLATWSTEKNRLHLCGRLAFLADRLVYTDPASGTHNTSLSRQIVTEAETRYRIGENHLLYGGLHNTLAFARHDNYGGWHHQNRGAVLVGYTWSHFSGKIQCALGLRQEILNLQRAPLTGSVGVTFAPWRWLEVKALGNRVYRAPTLNDLYWRPGGNPQLQPEHGFSAEGGLKLKTSWKAWRLSAEVTYFSRQIKNWIIWLPAGAFWTPQNLMQVWSRGTETHSGIEWHRKKIRLSLMVVSQYVLSTNRKSKLPGDASVGRQLIYTPMYSGLAALSLQISRLSFIYRQNYVGYRYISTDNSQFLPPYHLGSFSAEYHLKARHHLWGAFFQVFNIWNVAYQVMSQRPMPGRHFLAGLSWHFQSTPSKTSIRKPLKPITP